MPPILASFLTWGFIIWLFRRDIRQKPDVTRALWIPSLWFIIGCSRPIAVWLSMFGLPVPGGMSMEGGTPVDACFQFGTMAAGLFVLQKKGFTLTEFIRNNVWITIFLAYCFLAVFWSDFTFVALKRWVKDLNLPIMALIVLTEPNPMAALTQLMKRCAYIVIPVSILFIKYYPQWGRSFDQWTGGDMNSGITSDKNFLGVDCLLTGFFFVWYLLQIFQIPPGRRDKVWREELLLCVGFILMIAWLFMISNSRTPLVALVMGLLVMFYAGWKRIRKEYIGTYLVGGVALIMAIQMTFDVYGGVLKLLGRQPTLTGRTELWHDLLNLDINPVVGVGFESFWLGWQKKLPDEWETMINESHNGYLETYMTMGMVGVFLLVCMLVSTYRRACAELLRNVEWGRFRLGYFVTMVVYDCTEAGFRGIHPMMQMFYVIALNCPKPKLDVAPDSVEMDDAAMEPALEPAGGQKGLKTADENQGLLTSLSAF